MALEKLEFTKDWNNPEDFPTYEPSESKVRSDMQLLHDEVKDYLNKKVVPAVENVEEAVKNVNSANHTHGNLGVLNTITAVTQTLGNAADKVPSEAAVKKAISDFSTDAGLGDMSSATYDPQNKKTDVFKYADQAATAAKDAAVNAAKTEAEKLIAAAAPNEHNHQGQSLNPNSIELTGGNGENNKHGGYIDFHYGKSAADYTSRIVENEEGVLSAQFSGDPNFYNLLHTRNMTKTGGIINRNLLHNWNFLDPINSRGQSSYTGTGYHIDRWRGGYSTDVYTLTESGLKMENKRSDGLTWARQYLDDYLEPGTYTLSVLVTAVGDAVAYMSTSAGAAVPQTMALKVGLNTITAEVAADTVNRVQFTVGSHVTVAGIKLERGKVQTLAEQAGDGSWHLLDQPWDKGVEMLRCYGSTADPSDTHANRGAGGSRVAYGTFTGTGESGQDNPNVVNVGFTPKLFILAGGRLSGSSYKVYYFMMPNLVFGATGGASGEGGELSIKTSIIPTFGPEMRWYYETDSPGTNTDSLQGNYGGGTYDWIAFG